MKLSIVGFPRIGAKRELKKAVEGYFAKKISLDELLLEAKKIKSYNLQIQKNHGIHFIPSNDFSFYDHFLDTAILIGCIPQRYLISDNLLDVMFAMAKGYQDEKVDLKALPMKKWFNTNYHYIVPEIDSSTIFKLTSTKPFDEFNEALSIGIKTKPVIVGPMTFLKLSNVQSYKNLSIFIDSITKVYSEILAKFSNMGVKYVQIDEPILVTDLSQTDIEAFISIYEKLLKCKGACQIILQTYFGDIRDIYKKIFELDFDAIGLDFVEGKLNIELIGKYGFPKDKLLFAGVINGKNIWKNNYSKTFEIIDKLSKHIDTENIVLNSSCSLMHVPYRLDDEIKMDEKIKIHLSFAQEKLQELKELSEIILSGQNSKHEAYLSNVKLFNTREVDKEQFNNLTDIAAKRSPNFEERIKLQKKALKLDKLPTTTIGSFPQTNEIRKVRRDFREGNISFEEYDKFIKEKIKEVINLQEEIGLDVLVHGEFERNDMVEYFGENLDGFVITQNGWVQSYGTRCVKPPIIFGDIKRIKPITIDYITYAQSITQKPVKGMLTGPVTIINWSFPREDISQEQIAYQLALAIKDEVLDLEKNGIKIIQIDEAALREKLPLRKSEWNEYLSWAVKAFCLVHSSVSPTTQIHTHMCYSEFNDIIEYIDKMDADVISFEAARSNLNILDAINKTNFEKEVGPGVYDIHSPRIPSKEEIKEVILKIINKIPLEKVWINPDCGLKTRKFEEVIPSLKNMVEATAEIREYLK